MLRLGFWTSDYKLKEKTVKYRNRLLETRCKKTARLLKVRNEAVTGKMRLTQTILEREEYNVLKRYGPVVHRADNRWPKRIKHIHRKEDDDEVKAKQSGKRKWREGYEAKEHVAMQYAGNYGVRISNRWTNEQMMDRNWSTGNMLYLIDMLLQNFVAQYCLKHSFVKDNRNSCLVLTVCKVTNGDSLHQDNVRKENGKATFAISNTR